MTAAVASHTDGFSVSPAPAVGAELGFRAPAFCLLMLWLLAPLSGVCAYLYAATMWWMVGHVRRMPFIVMIILMFTALACLGGMSCYDAFLQNL